MEERKTKTASSKQKPWLIGITGIPGSGKTYHLAQLIDFLRREGRNFDGVISHAEGRTIPGKGAQEYILKWPLSGKEITICERRESGTPPYDFFEEAWDAVGEWISQLSTPEVLILDEFGSFEAQGKGFVRFWDQVLEKNPAIIVVSLKSAVQKEVEAQLGQSFDLILDASNPESQAKLRELCTSAKDWQRVGRFGAGAGAIEMSLGSMLHATKIPFRGMPLAAIQSVVLFFAGDRMVRPWLVIWVSYISAMLKALSPAGNRLRPMLAISVQGSLFGLSARVFGWNVIGISLGAFFVGGWSAFQGFVFQYLLLGRALFDAYGEVQNWVLEYTGILFPSLPVFIVFYVLVAGTFSVLLTGFFRWKKRPPELLSKILENPPSSQKNEPSKPKKWWQKLWREYRQKAFWVPLVVVFVVLVLSGSALADVAGLPLRAAGIVAAIFVIFSMMKPQLWINSLHNRGFTAQAITMERILGNYPKPDGNNG